RGAPSFADRAASGALRRHGHAEDLSRAGPAEAEVRDVDGTVRAERHRRREGETRGDRLRRAARVEADDHAGTELTRPGTARRRHRLEHVEAALVVEGEAEHGRQVARQHVQLPRRRQREDLLAPGDDREDAEVAEVELPAEGRDRRRDDVPLRRGDVDEAGDSPGGGRDAVDLAVVRLDDVEVAGDLYVVERSEEHTSELQSRQYLVC